MPTPFRAILFASAAVLAAPAALAQSVPALPDILQEDGAALPDFSYAGYGYGLVPVPTAEGTIIDPADFGAIPDDGVDDSAAVLEAMKAAHETDGPVIVRFAPGEFVISEIIKIERGDLVVQGAGRGKGGTALHFPRPLAMVGDDGKLDELRAYLEKYDKRQREPDRNVDVLFSEFSWSGGFFWIGKPDSRPAPYLEKLDKKPRKVADIAAGQANSRDVTLTKAAKLSVGDRIEVRWYNRDGEDAAIIDSIYGDTDEKIGSHHWTFKDRPIVTVKTTIEAIDGTDVRLASPLIHDVGADLPAEIVRIEPLENVGIESLALTFPNSVAFGHHMERGYNGIYMTGAADSWVRDVTITNADAGILTYDSSNLTLEDIRVDGTRKGHYAIHVGNVHNVLVDELLVATPVVHSLTFNTGSTKSVYKNAEVLYETVLDQHAGANHQNLFDAPVLHVTAKMAEDGTASYPLWDGSGAPYWQPGHGAYNTTWNAEVIVEGGAPAGMPVLLEGTAEGPEARIVGLHGNREFSLDYRPAPYIELMNEAVSAAPSLYDHQLAKRRGGQPVAGD